MVFTRVWGPLGSLVFKLALDTGATETTLHAGLLTDIGYDLSSSPSVTMTTGSGIIEVPELVVSQLEALGQTREDFPVLAHTLPPTATIDGLLGLDFMRGKVLNIDFRLGKLTLE